MFNLHTMGWHSFQQLCLSILRECLGQTVEAFLDVNDAGRDGAFGGTWQCRGGEALTGRFVVQCKFTKRPGYALTPSDLSEEVAKVQRLVGQGRCDVYVLLTNAGVSGETDLKIKRMFASVGVANMLTLGLTWIEQQIRESKRLRMMVPRVYGLGDLSQILDERAYAQATAVLESMREDLAKVVVTESYRRAVHALDEYGFVLLIGEPAAGKTTIASMLAMASVDQWGASLLKLDHPKAVVDHWNPHEQSQFFWIDDAFGVTQYESGLVMGWNHVLPQVKSLLRQGCRVVMTSRDYIYNRARQDLKEGAFPLFRESQVVIDVHDLGPEERRQILYNHLVLGKQPREFRIAVKPHLEMIADHQRFIPETARRLAEPFFTRHVDVDARSLERFVDRREQFLVDVCNGLDTDSRAALALVYMRNGRLVSPIVLAPEEAEGLQRMDSSLGACSTALKALRGSLLVYDSTEGEGCWVFRHPTVGDAYATILRSNPELLGIYLRGTHIDKLMDQVVCGDTQIQGAVIVPRSLFPLMIERLSDYKNSSSYKTGRLSTWGAERQLLRFLASRCSREFLELFLPRAPHVAESIAQPGLYLDYSPAVDLAIKLFKLGLLPEAIRISFTQRVTRYALDGADARVLHDSDVRAMLSADELEALRQGLLHELVPRLTEVRLDTQANLNGGDDPEDHMHYFVRLLEALEEEFPDDASLKALVADERSHTNSWIEENEGESASVEERQLAVAEAEERRVSARSIFDDVDE